MSLGTHLLWLVILALPIASISWAITHEEVFRELRDYCTRRSRHATRLWQRKLFYVFTCEYCFSHYVTIFFLFITRYKLLYEDWRGYLVGGFALVWVANLYMSLFGRLRLDIHKERVEIKEKEQETERRERRAA
jgi:hypothetical protein